MKNLISKILNEEIEDAKPLKKSEIYVFKHLNNVGGENKSNQSLLDTIKALITDMGMDPKKAQYYYQLYKANYRGDGAYEKITKANFKGPEEFSPTTTTNAQASRFVKSKLPFKGSNTEGKWRRDNLNVPYYVVISYNWYPIYIYKVDKWYTVSDTYSSSTSKQIRNLSPIEYNDTVKSNVVLVTPNEMKMLESSATYDEIIKHKFDKLVRNRETIFSKTSKNVSSGWGENQYDENRAIKIKFKVTNTEEVDGLFVITVLVDDAGFKSGQALVPSKGGYLRNEQPNLTKERVEKTIEKTLTQNLRDYLPKSIGYNEDLPENSKIKFEFKHLHEK
jgi:hypothetical protein